MRVVRDGFQSGDHWYGLERLFTHDPRGEFRGDPKDKAKAFAEQVRRNGALAQVRKCVFGWAVYTAKTPNA